MNNNEKIIWNLFKKTGDIRYFLLANKLKESEKNENSRCERTNTKRN